MKININEYDLYYFDCDGVLLDSNSVKSEAFFKVAKKFSHELAEEFLVYHQTNGGVSRFEKFKYFFSEMMCLVDYENELSEALLLFKEETILGLKNCNLVDGIEQFLISLPKESKKYVVSGGLEEEVQSALQNKNLDHFFINIFGSPKNKYEIMQQIYEPHKTRVFFGDSKLDYEVARFYDCDFFFISGFSEFKDYDAYFKDKEIVIKKNFLSFFN